MASKLDVYFRDDKIGVLTQEISGRMHFKYISLAVPQLSLAMPVRQDPYDDAIARPYFAGLLPEGEQRKTIARSNQIPEKNDFALLELLAGDCAGVVSLYPEGYEPVAKSKTKDFTVLSDDELDELIEKLEKFPMLAGDDDGIRMSLAGAQEKMAVYLDMQGRICKPEAGQISTHILKPDIKDKRLELYATAENEYFCMCLARNYGLNVPNVQLRNTKKHSFYLIERYDRYMNANEEVLRLHQEDFCQVSSVSPESKYQKHGHLGFRECFNFINEYSEDKPSDRMQLLNWTIFNYLIGNHDAHSKNISFLHDKFDFGTVITLDFIHLTPFYDLMSTAVYPELSKKMAMKIGNKYEPDMVFARHWVEFAKKCGLSDKYVKKILLEIAKTLPKQAKELAETDIQKEILKLIETRSTHILSLEW